MTNFSQVPRSLVDARASVPTRRGPFRFLVFHEHGAPAVEHVALVAGNVARADVLVRVHSECLTSEVFGSLKCDCAAQLDEAMARIARAGCGVILYLRQEGRGIGLANKIRAYSMQERGLDTVDANRVLGLPDDARRYDAAADLLAELGVRSVRLLTNNPAKVVALEELGVKVVREPIVVEATGLARTYVETKRARMSHVVARAPGCEHR
jgi:GTP cyclohydrolase II